MVIWAASHRPFPPVYPVKGAFAKADTMSRHSGGSACENTASAIVKPICICYTVVYST